MEQAGMEVHPRGDRLGESRSMVARGGASRRAQRPCPGERRGAGV